LIKGVGPKTATAIVAAVGDGSEFKNGRRADVGQYTVADQALDVGSRHPGNAAGFNLAILQKRLRDVISVASAS